MPVELTFNVFNPCIKRGIELSDWVSELLPEPDLQSAILSSFASRSAGVAAFRRSASSSKSADAHQPDAQKIGAMLPTLYLQRLGNGHLRLPRTVAPEVNITFQCVYETGRQHSYSTTGINQVSLP